MMTPGCLNYRWSTPARDDKDFAGRRVQTSGEAIWHKPEGDFAYAQFTLREIEYNVDVPETYRPRHPERTVLYRVLFHNFDLFLTVYETAKDEQIRKIASNHLYQVKAAVDIAALKNAVFDFRARFGRNPMNLDQLVRAGLLRRVPRDFDEKEYVYDPGTGAVTTSVNPWKR